MTTPRTHAVPSSADRVALRVIGIITAALTLALAVASATGAISFLTTRSVTLTLLADAQAPTETRSAVSSATFDSLTLRTEELSGFARGLFATGNGLLSLTAVAVGTALVWLMFSAASGRTFRATLPRVTIAAAFALILGPLGATGTIGLGSMQAAFELNDAVGGVLVPGFAVSQWGIAIPIVGFGVLALAFVLRRMAALQCDTEGLV